MTDKEQRVARGFELTSKIGNVIDGHDGNDIVAALCWLLGEVAVVLDVDKADFLRKINHVLDGAYDAHRKLEQEDVTTH